MMLTLRLSLIMCAEPSHITMPTQPGWKLKPTLTPFSLVQFKKQTGMMLVLVELDGLDRPQKLLPEGHFPLFSQQAQQPPGLSPNQPLIGVSAVFVGRP